LNAGKAKKVALICTFLPSESSHRNGSIISRRRHAQHSSVKWGGPFLGVGEQPINLAVYITTAN